MRMTGFTMDSPSTRKGLSRRRGTCRIRRDQTRPLTLGQAEVHLFNAGTAVLVNGTCGVTGAAWLQPQQLFQGRYARLGVQVTF